MTSRIILKEIPINKFQSAIFTSYSFNFYFFEQQVLPMLGSKGIHYVSLLIDGNMLSTQLDLYSIHSEHRKRNYSIHGIQTNGAFHPKIIFLVGETALLILVGSGNLTSAGHGKNLESWNAIYIEDPQDSKMGFAMQCWVYIKSLHNGLGKSALQKIKIIEENCMLLQNIDAYPIQSYYTISRDSSIGFLSAMVRNSLTSQLIKQIENDPVKTITVMCPFYDSKGNFLNMLNRRFNPARINIILQQEFGAAPVEMKSTANMHFYDWSDIKSKDIKQRFFHAKNIIFECKNHSYLISGSANASLAAFGNEITEGVNQEACVIYRGKNIDYLALLGLNIHHNRTALEYFVNLQTSPEEKVEISKKTVFITAIEKYYDKITVYYSSKGYLGNAAFLLYNPKGTLVTDFKINIQLGENELVVNIPTGTILMYGIVHKDSDEISNRQFVIDINAFDSSNPSPGNRSLNQLRKLIEGGLFSTPKIIEYLSTVHRHKSVQYKSVNGPKAEQDDEKQKIREGDNTMLYLTYEEIQNQIKNLEAKKKEKVFVEYRTIRIWDSIYSYLKESKQREEDAKIDEEETEDINNSTGRQDKAPYNPKKPITKALYESLKWKTEKFLNNYLNTLEAKVNAPKAGKPSLIDLSMYLIVIEIVLHLLGHHEKIGPEQKGQTLKKDHLLRIQFSEKDFSWSECILKITGLFTLWCSQKDGFEDTESKLYKLKIELYRELAFKASITALALFSYINRKYQVDYNPWITTGLLNANRVFNQENKLYDINAFNEFVPSGTKEYIGESLIDDSISAALEFIRKHSDVENPLLMDRLFLHETDGYCFVIKTIHNQNDLSKSYLKLINTGYEWHVVLKDYWNGKVYSVQEMKWMSSKRA